MKHQAPSHGVMEVKLPGKRGELPSVTGKPALQQQWQQQQPRKEHLGMSLQNCRRKVEDQGNERRIYFFCHLPLEGWLKREKKKKKLVCSFSGIITGPPRFSFRFQMRADMFRLVHLCSGSTELPAFYWQIRVSLNLCTIDVPKNLQILSFRLIPPWVNFFSTFTLLAISQKVKEATRIGKKSWIVLTLSTVCKP